MPVTLATGPINARPVHFGGPVEGGRGFVLHTTDYNEEATLVVGPVSLPGAPADEGGAGAAARQDGQR